jgi:hypothetical protein
MPDQPEDRKSLIERLVRCREAEIRKIPCPDDKKTTGQRT